MYPQHYHLDQENVQYLALRLSSKARSVYTELRQAENAARSYGGSAGEEEDGEEEEEENGKLRGTKKRQERVSTAVIGGVADALSSVKDLVCWLNRYVLNFLVSTLVFPVFLVFKAIVKYQYHYVIFCFLHLFLFSVCVSRAE